MLRCILRTWLIVSLTGALVAAAQADEPLSFNRDIRPILSDACFQCHGPDEAHREAGLRLDLREVAIGKLASGATALVPHKLAESELVRRLTIDDNDLRMPPAGSGKSITPQQIKLLKRWVSEGADYAGHWAFLAPVRPAVPEATAESTSPNPIDRFIRARLKAANLQPSPAADKTTLLRRATLDLTGLPPTLEEIDAFLADDSPDAYEKVVDRLLQSPHYGERMALQWLDFARYADSNGYQIDSSRFMWPWRNWVIDAYNRNLPFDQFTIEQIAGDMLPNATPDQIVATGFNRNHRLNGEGGIIGEEWRIETVIDRVETTGLTWLGLTFNCCRCHDHKFDPIKQTEFYQFFAYFNNVPESGTLQGETKNTDPVVVVNTPEMETQRAAMHQEIAHAKAQVEEKKKLLPELVAAWEPGFREQLKANRKPWSLLELREVKSAGGATLTKQTDGTYLASGENPAHDTYEITTSLAPGSFTGLLLECFPDASLPNQSLGRYPNGNFVLTRVEAEITAPGLQQPLKAAFTKVAADYSQNGWEIQFVLGHDRSKGWAVDGPTKRDPRRAMFLAEQPLTVPADATLVVRLYHEAIAQHNIGRFRLSATSLPAATVTLDGAQIPELVTQAIALASGSRTAEQQQTLADYFQASTDNPIQQAASALKQVEQRLAEIEKTAPNVMVMREGPVREAFRLNRGEYDQPAEKVSAGVPAFLPPLPADAPNNRLGLAQWMVSPSNPLTSRVWVNRAWEKFFGTGLVKTSENFGSQAEYPSHPELLDWLAVEFREPTITPAVAGQPPKPWDMKAFQKLIVMSDTYRQSSRVSPEQLQADPENRLLARSPRIRLQGELVRDQALAVSGLLARTIGGPSVRPYMPEGVWDETSRYGDLRNYQHDKGAGLYRRSMYTVWKRTAAPPSMLLFDAPNREVCTTRRSRTNTPLQALSLLNEITFVEAARQLGQRMLLEGGSSPAERITYAFRVTLARAPTEQELNVLQAGLLADLEKYKHDAAAAKELVSFGDAMPAANVDLAALAAYTVTANVLLNLDEFITRE